MRDEILLAWSMVAQQIVLSQSKGISSSSLKHLRYLKRFLATMNSYKSKYPGPGGASGAVGHSPPPGLPGQQLPHPPPALKRPRPGTLPVLTMPHRRVSSISLFISSLSSMSRCHLKGGH